MGSMDDSGALLRRQREQLDRSSLAQYQLQRLSALLERIVPHNALYARKLRGVDVRPRTLDDLRAWPLTTKAELQGEAPQADVAHYAANHTWPIERYVRYHQTSGTRGRPLVLLDTADDWRWWIDTWQYVLDAAHLAPHDRIFMAFSFGPFVGFWSAFEAALARGCLVVPGGGMSTLARLQMMRHCRATAVFCTPSYALHMAEVAAENTATLGFALRQLEVRVLVVAGEPGGSIPATRQRIEDAWQARVVDHAGASEVGPWGYADPQGLGLFVNEAEFLPEFLAVGSDRPAAEGELAELVLTNLGRAGCPVIRYRTGDLVRPRWQHPYARAAAENRPPHAAAGGAAGAGYVNRFVLLEGGILGRADDMLVIRGVNIYPSAVEQILREFPEIAEFRLTAVRRGALDGLEVEIEDRAHAPHRVQEALRLRLGLHVEVRDVPPGTLPRYEMKARRFVDRRGGP
jgi:phenylacetate-CoA ligase